MSSRNVVVAIDSEPVAVCAALLRRPVPILRSRWTGSPTSWIRIGLSRCHRDASELAALKPEMRWGQRPQDQDRGICRVANLPGADTQSASAIR